MTVQEIASWLEGEVSGDHTVQITGVAKIEEARPGQITFLANPKYEKFLETTKASAVLVSKQFVSKHPSSRPSLTLIKVQDPYVAFLHVLKKLVPQPDPFPKGIHPTAVIAKSAKVGSGVTVGAFSVIGENAVVGDNTRISHGCVIGDEAGVGDDCQIYPHVTVYHQCKIGNRVTLHAGTVVGSDGFGFAPKADGTYEKIPQLGIATLGDDVEVGANAAIDRATLGETLISRGVKLDNMVHVGHNVVIGENTVIAAQTGISGSTKIGKNCMVGGQVGFGGHLEIADGSIILGQAGVSRSLTVPGKSYFGTPAKEQHRAQRMEAALRSLPELSREFVKLQQELAALREELMKFEQEERNVPKV